MKKIGLFLILFTVTTAWAATELRTAPLLALRKAR